MFKPLRKFLFALSALLTASSAFAQAPVWSVVNGKIMKDGQQVFPRGFYYVSYYASEKTQRLADVQKMASGGYNFINTPIDRNDKALLDKAASVGMNVSMEFNDDPNYLINTFKTHPALAWLNTFDDVDAYTNNAPRYSPTTVGQKSSGYKALAPSKLTYVSGGYPTRLANYIGTADVIGMQTYPIPYEPLSSVTKSYLGVMAPKMQTALQPFIANLQTFGWNGTARFPTAMEVRNMTYQALNVGVQGIMYYAYRDYSTNLNNNSTLWTELTKIGSELKTLEPFLLKGTRKSLYTGKSEVFATSWKLGKELIVAVVNSSTATQTINLNFTDNLNGTRVNLFANRPATLTLSAKTLRGSMTARDVQVYKLGLY